MKGQKRRLDYRPLIGISTRLEPVQGKFYLQSNYSEAIEDAGGAPLLVPLIPVKDFIRRLADTLGGIVLSGSGSDVNPQSYGTVRHPRCEEVHTARDETDFLLLEEAFKRQLPILAICFGVQSLNVFLGGTLIQDISSQWPNALDHSLSTKKPSKTNPENFCSHPIVIKRHSLLFKLAREKESLRVNSSHHQAIETLARDLKVTARAPDGIIEGVELDSAGHFVFGTQWHPEKGFERDPLSRAIFRRFVDEAKKK